MDAKNGEYFKLYIPNVHLFYLKKSFFHGHGYWPAANTPCDARPIAVETLRTAPQQRYGRAVSLFFEKISIAVADRKNNASE